MQAAVRMSEAGQEDEAKELLKIAASYQAVEDKLAGYADEVKAGQINRSKPKYARGLARWDAVSARINSWTLTCK